MGSLSRPNFVIFPFMSQGHTIPLLHLSRLLLRRSISVTIFTTPGNSQPIRTSLNDVIDLVSLIELPFPQNIQDVPPGVENTHNLPSMSSFVHFVKSTKLMQQSFERSLKTLFPPVSCIISDGFLGWTVQSAKLFSVPRFVFFGMSNFSCTMYQILGREKPQKETKSVDEEFIIPDFPYLKLTRNDFDPPFGDIEPTGEYVDFMIENVIAMAMSQGVIVNSFHELESKYASYWDLKIGPKCYNIGPLCLANKESSLESTDQRECFIGNTFPPRFSVDQRPSYMKWLDEKQAKGESVLYVAFGTQAEVSEEQLEEISKGLEESKVNFLWVLKKNESLVEFQETVKNRGIIVNGWVDQLEVLSHESVTGFLSHCGWNSVVESVSVGVPIIGMPFLAEQHLNARFVALIGIGVRVSARNGSVRGFVEAEEIARKVKEVMNGGEDAGEMRKKVAGYGRNAHEAMKGGSSSRALSLLIDDVCVKSVSHS